MENKKIITLFLLIIYLNLFAAYLTNLPQTLSQLDGTKFSCFASGDEFHNWLHDENNFTIMIHPHTGYYVYARQHGEDIVASDYVVGSVDPASVGLEPGANAHPANFEQRTAEFRQILSDLRSRVSTIGELNNLVVFIRFADQTEFTQPLSAYDNMFNASGQNSLHEYYQEVSDEQLDITSYFYPEPNGNVIVSYQSPNPRAYYLPYNASSNPIGYQSGQQAQREHELLQAAIQFIEPQIPTTLDLDNDDDGRVDNVCFIVKGATGAWADLLWPHMWVLYTLDVFIHGVQVWTYNFQLSESLSSSGVGVLCHEMFHSLGAPDLYHYTGNGIDPTGSWDLMCSNTNPPQHMNAWMKFKYGLWFDEVPEINTTGSYTLEPLADSPFSCYKIPSPNSSTEFFIVEYRRRTGLFEPSIPGDGLLIYRIDSNENGNAQGPPDEVYLFRPDGTTTVNGNINQANFAADFGRTMFNDNTNPACFLQYGQPGGIFIHNIGYVADTIDFTLETGMVAMFDSNVQSGPANLGVQFQNISFSNSTIDLFMWDLDGDGYIDSYDENPYFLYEQQGCYDVTLTIISGSETSSKTVENYITVTDTGSISGDISGIWTAQNGPYTIIDNVAIQSGDMLTIEAGTEILTDNESQLVVYGTLRAEGTADNRVIFSSNNEWKGIRITNSQENNLISNCEFSKAVYSAILIDINSTVSIRDNIFYENSSYSLGAAIDVNGCDNVEIIRNIIANNSSTNNAGGIGCLSASPFISNNIIVNNEGGYAGAISLKNGSAPIIENNTIANNASQNSAIFIFNSSPVIRNSIIRDNGNIFNIIGGCVDVTYSCVSGGYAGVGNIDADPMFVNPSCGNGTAYDGLSADWHLAANSPCINAGNPAAQFNDPDGSINDMGAFGGPNSYGCTDSQDDEFINSIVNSFSIFPNPFNPTTTIRFAVSQLSSSPELSIYNLKGQKVKSFTDQGIFDEAVENNLVQVVWNGRDEQNRPVASGIYFVRLKSGSHSFSKKVMLLK